MSSKKMLSALLMAGVTLIASSAFALDKCYESEEEFFLREAPGTGLRVAWMPTKLIARVMRAGAGIRPGGTFLAKEEAEAEAYLKFLVEWQPVSGKAETSPNAMLKNARLRVSGVKNVLSPIPQSADLPMLIRDDEGDLAEDMYSLVFKPPGRLARSGKMTLTVDKAVFSWDWPLPCLED